MNKETKLERFYSPEKMKTAIFMMEQYFALWHDETTDE